MAKRVCDVEREPIPGTSDRKRALYESAVTQPVKLSASRTGIAGVDRCVAALPDGCSLCVAPCRDEAGSPSSAVFVLDHVRRVAFELRARHEHAPHPSGPLQPSSSVATCVEAETIVHPHVHTPAPPPLPPPTVPRVVSSRGASDAHMAPPEFYEDITRAPSPPVSSLPPAGAGSPVVPLNVAMPVDLLEKHRNALLYCHVCKVYIPPHVVNLESHLNTQHIHQRGQDTLIAEAVKAGVLVDHTTGRSLSIRELANRQPKSAQRPPSLMVSEKNYEAVPAFILPQSLITSEEKDTDVSLRVFWEAGLDVVYPFCGFCDEKVSLQLLSAHKKKQKHIDRQHKQTL